MYADIPLPSWFPELGMDEVVYMRRDPRKNSQEPYTPVRVKQLYRSDEMPNLDVIHGRELIHNVLHQDDPRLLDPNFMATATSPDAPGVGGVFILNPTRMKQEAEIASIRTEFQQQLDDLKAEIAALRRKRETVAAA